MRKTSGFIVATIPGSRSTFRHPFPRHGVINRERVFSLISQGWFLNRTAVNPDTDRFVNILAPTLGAEVLAVPAGQECLTWRVPLRWRVNGAQLRRQNGEILADFADNPLHLWTHSIPFKGEVSRTELLNHIQTDANRPDEILYHYRNGYRHDAREWGFSLPYRTVEALFDASYMVDIDTELDLNGSLKVVDAFLPGELPDTIFFMAHTCHPAQVSDGIGCIAVAAELYHFLAAQPSRRYSYRFLFGPEYFAAAAWLANASTQAVNALRFGVYLDMVTSNEAMGFQSSMQGNSRMDKVVRNIFASHLAISAQRPYRKLWGNDETFYNGPGFLIPTLGIGRTEFREYHYDTDDLDNFSPYKAEESAWILRRITEVFETDCIPELNFRGPLYLSRDGLYIDPIQDSKGAENLERMLALMDGTRSCMDIADILDIDFFFVRDFCRVLEENGLAKPRPRPVHPQDAGCLV